VILESVPGFAELSSKNFNRLRSGKTPMANAADQIRPRAEFLQKLPTLARETPREGTGPLRDSTGETSVDFVLELKLERLSERYWLCTKGAIAAEAGIPKGWIEGYVTPEYRTGDGPWEAGCPYGPGETAWLQGYDYLNFLGAESERLEEAYKDKASPAIGRQLQALWEEIDEVSAALRRHDPAAPGQNLPVRPVHLTE
jgi:hypothetical protein